MKQDRTICAHLTRALPALALTFFAAACSDEGAANDGAPGDGDGDGDEAAPVACVIPDGSGDAVSFRTDIMPVFGLSCSAQPCHGDTGRAADLYLGPACMWNTDSARCEFPSGASDPAALTDEVVAQVIDNLVGAASTTSPSSERIVAGDPGASFLMEKVAAIHNDVGHDDCTVQQTGAQQPCGDAMPPTGSALCEQAKGPELMDMLARWVAQGAKDS